MNNGNKYIFKIIVNSRLFDAYEAVDNTLEIYGIVISKDYRERTVVGKWNPMLHNELGAKINVWTGEFRLWEDGSTTVVRLILSGNGDKASAKIMAKFFYKKLKKFISVQNMYLDKSSKASNNITKNYLLLCKVLTGSLNEALDNNYVMLLILQMPCCLKRNKQKRFINATIMMMYHTILTRTTKATITRKTGIVSKRMSISKI